MPPKKPVKKWKPQDYEINWYVLDGVNGKKLTFSFEFFRTKSAALKAAKEVKALLKKLPKE